MTIARRDDGDPAARRQSFERQVLAVLDELLERHDRTEALILELLDDVDALDRAHRPHGDGYVPPRPRVRLPRL